MKEYHKTIILVILLLICVSYIWWTRNNYRNNFIYDLPDINRTQSG